MDQWRAMECFVTAAQEHSFSAAARRLDVTIPAVAKMVRALETSLGVMLFQRSSTGLALTAEGSDYLETCTHVLAQIHDANERMRSVETRARGTVTAAVQHAIAWDRLGRALPRFHSRHPDIRVDLRDLMPMTDANLQDIDVVVGLGWLKAEGNWVQRRVGSAGFSVCASPSYWSHAGMPSHPSELAHHNCVLLRHPFGTVLDVWSFRRGDEAVQVTVDGWLVVSNAHRESMVQAALAGHGVVRVADWAYRDELASGQLVPAFKEWEVADSAPVNVWYPPNVRRTLRVRLFVEFIAEVFQDPTFRSHQVPSTAPTWLRKSASRASSEVARRMRGAR